MNERVKGGAWAIISCLMIAAIFLQGGFALRGTVWVSDKALPWLNLAISFGELQGKSLHDVREGTTEARNSMLALPFARFR